MQDFLIDTYLWWKTLHILAVISWMAGMLYLPRLYVYHVDAKKGSKQSETFKVMEYRLLRYITNPAMIVAWLAGGAMIYAMPSMLEEGWMHVKLTMLLGMQIVHAMLARHRRQFDKDENSKGDVYFRVLNEVPTVLMIVIVIMVVVRPF